MDIERFKKEVQEELDALNKQRKIEDAELKAEILSIKDTAERQRQIRKHIRLFQNQIGGR